MDQAATRSRFFSSNSYALHYFRPSSCKLKKNTYQSEIKRFHWSIVLFNIFRRIVRSWNWTKLHENRYIIKGMQHSGAERIALSLVKPGELTQKYPVLFIVYELTSFQLNIKICQHTLKISIRHDKLLYLTTL